MYEWRGHEKLRLLLPLCGSLTYELITCEMHSGSRELNARDRKTKWYWYGVYKLFSVLKLIKERENPIVYNDIIF